MGGFEEKLKEKELAELEDSFFAIIARGEGLKHSDSDGEPSELAFIFNLFKVQLKAKHLMEKLRAKWEKSHGPISDAILGVENIGTPGDILKLK